MKRYWKLAERGREDCLGCYLDTHACETQDDPRCTFYVPPRRVKEPLPPPVACTGSGRKLSPLMAKKLPEIATIVQDGRYLQSEVAKQVGVHPSAITRWVKLGLIEVERRRGGAVVVGVTE
jgi:hypothetical protein